MAAPGSGRQSAERHREPLTDVFCCSGEESDGQKSPGEARSEHEAGAGGSGGSSGDSDDSSSEDSDSGGPRRMKSRVAHIRVSRLPTI